MGEQVTPMKDTPLEKFMSKMEYSSDNISDNMFSAPVKKGKKPMVGATVLKDVSIQKLWDSVFADSSDFLKRYHDKRKETNLKVGSWDYAQDKGSGSRFVSLTTTIDVPRAGTQTALNEAHRFAYTTTGDGVLMIYQISSQTPNVTAGSSFRTEALFEITAKSPEAECTVSVWGNCKKMSVAFSAIQYMAVPRAIKEMTAGYKMMLDMISQDLCGGEAAASSADAGDGDNGTDGADADDGGGEDEGSGSSSTAFQGVLLILALLVTIMLFSSMSSIRGTAWHAATLARSLSEAEGGDHGFGGRDGCRPVRSSLSAKLNLEQSSGSETNCIPLTEDEALQSASREAQIQALRYRWLEQKGVIDTLDRSVSRLWWFNMLQIILLAGLFAKVFFFSASHAASE